jgi:hypothetical protein
MNYDKEFLVFGSVVLTTPTRPPNDIDLVIPEFVEVEDTPDGQPGRFYTATIDLERYEKLAAATGKPIDLFFSRFESDFNLAGWYEPGGRWKFRQAFCGKWFFEGLVPMTFEQIVDAVLAAAGAYALVIMQALGL